MATRKGRPATYDDLKRLPDNVVGEILAGELIVSPRPSVPHTQTASMLGSEIIFRFNRPPGGSGGPGGWWVVWEPELHLHGDVVVPDVAGWRRERMPKLPTTPAIELPPDWVCEVRSPSTARIDRMLKMPIYAREGVKHLWSVDPSARMLEVFRLDGGQWISVAAYDGESSPARIEPFEAIEIDLSRTKRPRLDSRARRVLPHSR
jgi:Uma2 family endonuclease